MKPYTVLYLPIELYTIRPVNKKPDPKARHKSGGPKAGPKSTQSRPKVRPKLHQRPPKVVPKLFQGRAEVRPESDTG